MDWGGRRKEDGNVQTGLLLLVRKGESDFRADAMGNRLNDRQSQARTDLLATQHAVEAIKNPAPFGQRDAGTVVLNTQLGFPFRYTHGKIDPPTLWCLANGVIDQILDQGDHVQLARPHFGVLRAFDPDVDVLGLGQRHEVFQHPAVDALDGYR